MKLYKTYQEAKINNPNGEILTTSKGWDGGMELIGTFGVNDGSYLVKSTGWEVCDLSDYCMSMEDFLEFGYKLSEGDIVIGFTGLAFALESQEEIEIYNYRSELDNKRYVLKAKAFDVLTETPEEKEALDSIKPIADVGIKKGDACEINGESGSFTLVGFTKNGCVVECESGELEVYPKCSLKKPNYKAKLELKERVETFNDMFDLIRDKSLNSHGYIDICESLYDAGYRKVS